MMVQLAVKDPHVVAAIAGRPVSVMTRPEARSSYQVRSAAERAASTALRNREHAEWQKAAAASEVATDAALIAAPDILAPDTTKREVDTIQDWRARRSARIQQIPAVPGTDHRLPEDVAPMASTPTASIRSIIRPILRSARNGLAAAGVLAPNQDQRSRAVKAWLQELDSHVAMVRVDLEDVGA
jgi:hypothetical protein